MSTQDKDIKTIQTLKIEVKEKENVFHFCIPIGCSLGSAYDACIKCAKTIAHIIQEQLKKVENEKKKSEAPEIKKETLEKGEIVKNLGD